MDRINQKVSEELKNISVLTVHQRQLAALFHAHYGAALLDMVLSSQNVENYKTFHGKFNIFSFLVNISHILDDNFT